MRSRIPSVYLCLTLLCACGEKDGTVQSSSNDCRKESEKCAEGFRCQANPQGVYECLADSAPASHGTRTTGPRGMTSSTLKDARALLKSKKPDEAIEKFKAVLAEEPDNFHALFGTAEAHKQTQRWDEQETVLKKIMENPTHMEERGQMLQKELLANYLSQAAINKTKDPAKAESMYRKILTIDPKDKKANRALVDMFWDRGVKAQKAGQYENAAKAFELAAGFRMSKKRKNEIEGRMKMVQFFVERGRV